MTAQKTHSEELLKENIELKNELAFLKEQLEWCKRHIFGKKSEKTIANLSEKQLTFEGFSSESLDEKETSSEVKGHTRKKRKTTGKDKITLPPDLPLEKKLIDLSEEEKICQKTGLPLKKIGEERTLKLCVKPGSYFLKEIIRPKYAFPKASDEGIKTANLPESLLERCQADESFLADILVKKYADHLPIYRVQEILARSGIKISRQTLCSWVRRSGEALQPLYNEMKLQILKSKNIFVDETPIPLFVKGKGKLAKGYMWLMLGGQQKDPPWKVYQFYPDRKHKRAEDFLGKSYEGVLHSDKYAAYTELVTNSHKSITWCPCFVHIRRKFFEAQSGDKEFRSWMLMKIRHLFMYEKVAWNRSEQERLRIRKEKESILIDKMIEKVKLRIRDKKLLPKSKFKEALGYFYSLIPYLKNYHKYAYARLDNNVAERAIRPLAIGRKNWLFIGSEDSGQAAAVIISLVQTCRGLNINPYEYLEDIMRRLMSYPSNKIHELLPDQWLKLRQKP